MASSGKKGKKSKGIVLSLQSFLSNGDVPIGTTQVAKNIRNVDGEDSDEGGNMLTVFCELPTAPRASRMFDDNSIPHKSPFIAYITNLPFDVKENDIYEYFVNNNVKSIRLPREDGDTGRLRGFGYVEFESRDDLIQSLGIRDPTIKGRRIRIDLSNENEPNSRQRGGKRVYDSAGNNEGRELSNWRRDNNTQRDLNNFCAERNFKDQKYGSDDNNSPGSWRKKNQSTLSISSSTEKPLHKDSYECPVNKNDKVERPKLILKPRTLPLPEVELSTQFTLESKNDISLKLTGKATENVFGSAKPVDTTARDLEIEERLADVRRQDTLRNEIIRTTNDLKDLSFVKDEKDKNVNQNWRQENESVETGKNKNRRDFAIDGRQEHVKDNRKRFQSKSEGRDNQKDKEGKRKDSIKIKGEVKVDHQGLKNICSLKEYVLSANKYSGLEEDSN